MQRSTASKSDLERLVDLNRDYLRAVEASDAVRFNEMLAAEFFCSNPDGSLIDRKEFLERIKLPATISNLEASDVKVRIMGEFAIIHARTSFTMPDGRQGAGRYTDVWARQNGRWLAVSAHVTRC